MTPENCITGKRMRRRPRARPALRSWLACCAACLARPAEATPQTFALTPATTSLGLTVYALGFFPLPGTFPSFRGTLEIDRDHPGFCRVSIVVDQASLRMADPDRARRALAPDMLDATQYPTMSYTGTCKGMTTEGQLTLHGVTRPLTLDLARYGDTVKAEGRLIRRDYAVDGMQHLLGPMIRIHFSTTLPML